MPSILGKLNYKKQNCRLDSSVSLTEIIKALRGYFKNCKSANGAYIDTQMYNCSVKRYEECFNRLSADINKYEKSSKKFLTKITNTLSKNSLWTSAHFKLKIKLAEKLLGYEGNDRADSKQEGFVANLMQKPTRYVMSFEIFLEKHEKGDINAMKNLHEEGRLSDNFDKFKQFIDDIVNKGKKEFVLRYVQNTLKQYNKLLRMDYIHYDLQRILK